MGFLENQLESLFSNIFSAALATFLTGIVILVVWILIGIIINIIKDKAVMSYYTKRKGDKRGKTLGSLVSSTLNVVIWFIIIMIVLDYFGIDTTPILASAGVLGLAIGFGAQSLVKDVVSGFFIILDNVFNIDENIEVNGFKGKVIHMNLRVTQVKNYMGSILVINNGQINSLINWSRENNVALVDFGVDYDTDLSKLQTLMQDFMTTLKERYKDILETPTFLGVTELADSSINLRIMATTTNGEQSSIERKIRKDLVEFLNKHHIEMPFPQLVLHNTK
ncbi:MAG: mechanosensitive ion channel family protein [Candidatus Izemoplasmataceae bacterium]